MPPRKRRRRGSAVSSASTTCRFPSDILLEITARSDAATITRFAAACKSLRREILNPDFISRVCSDPDDGGVVPGRPLLGFIDDESTFRLVHPTTPAAVSLAEHHLAPFVSRGVAGLLEQYRPLTSRGGLVLPERRHINTRRRSERRSDMCVYDPMTNARAFLPMPAAVRGGAYDYSGKPRHHGPLDHLHNHVLLTPADGIGCSFRVIAVDIVTCVRESLPFRVQTVSSDDAGKWSPVVYVGNPAPPGSMPVERDNGGVFIDGVVHWLMMFSHHVLTYKLETSTAGMIRLPVDRLPAGWRPMDSCLGSSPSGKLRLPTMDGLSVSIWLLSPSPGGWTRHAQVDIHPALCSLSNRTECSGHHWIELESSGDQRSGAVLMRLRTPPFFHQELLVLDTETMETSKIEKVSGLPFEVNLSSRLSAMKNFC